MKLHSEYELAQQYYEQALFECEKAIKLGNCYVEMQDSIKAADSYKEALSCFEKTLSKTPNSKSAILSKEKISQLIMQLEQCK